VQRSKPKRCNCYCKAGDKNPGSGFGRDDISHDWDCRTSRHPCQFVPPGRFITDLKSISFVMLDRQRRAYSSAKAPDKHVSELANKEGVMVLELPDEAELEEMFTSDPPEVTAFVCLDDR
jgi:hypothetical protein